MDKCRSNPAQSSPAGSVPQLEKSKKRYSALRFIAFPFYFSIYIPYNKVDVKLYLLNNVFFPGSVCNQEPSAKSVLAKFIGTQKLRESLGGSTMFWYFKCIRKSNLPNV